jgi:hypothetical protein
MDARRSSLGFATTIPITQRHIGCGTRSPWRADHGSTLRAPARVGWVLRFRADVQRRVFAATLRRTHGLRRRTEEAKKRRRARLQQRTGWRQCASRSHHMASAATRFARQGVRESQMQAALDRALFAFAILGLPVSRPIGRRRRTRTTASYLRIFALIVGACSATVTSDCYSHASRYGPTTLITNETVDTTPPRWNWSHSLYKPGAAMSG